MTTVEPAILNWRDDEESDTGDLLHKHFDEVGSEDCCDISDEARRLYNAMFKEYETDVVEKNSMLDNFLYAAVGAGHDAAMRKIARLLGVPWRQLETFVEDWAEADPRQPYSGLDGLRKGLQEVAVFYKQLDGR